MTPIEGRPTPWTAIVLLCGKCSRKLDGGFGPKRRDTLRSALNDELRSRGQRRRVRIVETKCFGICPKKAVVAVNATSPGELLTVPRNADAAEIIAALGLFNPR